MQLKEWYNVHLQDEQQASVEMEPSNDICHGEDTTAVQMPPCDFITTTPLAANMDANSTNERQDVDNMVKASPFYTDMIRESKPSVVAMSSQEANCGSSSGPAPVVEGCLKALESASFHSSKSPVVDSELPSASLASSCIDCNTSLQTPGGRPRRKCTPSAAAVNAVANALTPPRTRGKRQHEPSVEDVYLNKLWKSQMPKEKAWETIYEQPLFIKKVNKEEYVSTKKFKRSVEFDNQHTPSKMRRRRQRAMKHGWKPSSKKQQEKFRKLLDAHLVKLDQEIAKMDSVAVSEKCSQVSDSSLTDSVFSTPVKAALESGAVCNTPEQSGTDHALSQTIDCLKLTQHCPSTSVFLMLCLLCPQ